MIVFLGILAGVGLPIQTSINARLKNQLGSPYKASLASFIVALIFLITLLLFTGQNVMIPFARLLSEPIWIWAGGLCGVIFLTGNILLLAKLGGVQTVIFPVVGQVFMGLIIDTFGFFYAEQKILTLYRLFGCLLVILGVLLVSLEKNTTKLNGVEESVKQNKSIWICRILGIFTGGLSSMQVAINGYLGRIIESPIKASVISFLIGILFLSLLCIYTGFKQRKIKKYDLDTAYPLWTWSGGVFGGFYILANILLSGEIGPGTTVILLLVGATLGGLLIDCFGLFGQIKKHINLTKLFGMIIMVLGAITIKFF